MNVKMDAECKYPLEIATALPIATSTLMTEISRYIQWALYMVGHFFPSRVAFTLTTRASNIDNLPLWQHVKVSQNPRCWFHFPLNLSFLTMNIQTSQNAKMHLSSGSYVTSYFGIRVRIIKRRVRIVVVAIAKVIILQNTHYYYFYYYHPYPALHNPNPNPKVCPQNVKKRAWVKALPMGRWRLLWTSPLKHKPIQTKIEWTLYPNLPLLLRPWSCSMPSGQSNWRRH